MKKPTSGTTDLTTGRPLTRILLFALTYCVFMVARVLIREEA